MSKKKLVYITELLYFDNAKFKRHLKKRQFEEVLQTEQEYIDIMLDILINHERLFITEDNYRKKYVLLRLNEWLLIFDEEYRIFSAFKIKEERFSSVEELLDSMIIDKAFNKYWEVKDERSEYKRFVERIQKRT